MKKLLWVISLIVLFLLSYIREVSFIGINAIIEGQSHNYANTQLPGFFYSLSTSQLYQLKWILTALFSLFFMLVSFLGIRFSINKSTGSWTAISYAVIIFVTLIVLSLGLIVAGFHSVYPFLRTVIGIVHSPLIFLMISISYYAMKTLKRF